MYSKDPELLSCQFCILNHLPVLESIILYNIVNYSTVDSRLRVT